MDHKDSERTSAEKVISRLIEDVDRLKRQNGEDNDERIKA